MTKKPEIPASLIPKVGDRGRRHVGSDVYPITCTRVSKTGRIVHYKQDNFSAGPGHDYFGTQNWVFEENPKNALEQRADWSDTWQCYQVKGCGSVFFDGWMAYQDPSI